MVSGLGALFDKNPKDAREALTFGPGLGDQFAAELFYRWQLTREFALTPDAQLIFNPALNPGAEVQFIGGLRARLAL